MTPLGNRAASFVVFNNRNTYTPYTSAAYITGMAPEHHRLVEFFIPITRGYHLTGTYHIFLSYWYVLTVSEQDNSIVMVTDLLQFFRKVVLTTAKEKTKSTPPPSGS